MTTPREHMERAAQAAVEQGLDLEAFMQAAWATYMDARPGLREHLQDLQLIAEIETLRNAGRIGQA